MSDKILADHLPDAVNKFTGAGLGATGASTLWSWIGTNHTQLTVCIALIGLIVTIYGVFRRPK